MSEADLASLPRSRSEAKAQGSGKYLTGKACAAGHLAPRYTGSGSCVVCVSTTMKQVREDPEANAAILARQRARRASNPLVQGREAFYDLKRRHPGLELDVPGLWAIGELCLERARMNEEAGSQEYVVTLRILPDLGGTFTVRNLVILNQQQHGTKATLDRWLIEVLTTAPDPVEVLADHREAMLEALDLPEGLTAEIVDHVIELGTALQEDTVHESEHHRPASATTG